MGAGAWSWTGVLPVAGDVCQAGDVSRLGAVLRERAADLSGVFYCVGVSRPDFVEALDVERAVDTVRVNFEGALRVFYEVLPLVRAQAGGGFLAGFTSMAADRGFPRGHSYCAAKAALDRLLESLRIDLYETSVKIFTIVPGYVETPMSAQNRFPMPGIWPVGKGVTHILRRLEREEQVIRFPWYHSWGMALLGLLPNRLYWWLASRQRGQVRIEPQAGDRFQWNAEPGSAGR
ncbi:MAG: SDR family NAD(P)-dependent oxidoreductase [Candidatus Riflebacteria bacterium]|nr:SDR family NAD(P)-dependent oxidoreductase [Candidatus Riflebacteria bacterium]